MKKITISLAVILLVISAIAGKCNASIDYNKINKQTWNILEEAIKEYMEPFKSEDVPEEKRITDYLFSGYGNRGVLSENEVCTKYTIDFSVTPVNEENTVWLRRNLLYVDLKYENGEFTIEKISDKPEYWDEFCERFKEYKKTNQDAEIEVTQIETQQIDIAKSEQVEQLSNRIYIISEGALIGGIISLVFLLKSSI